MSTPIIEIKDVFKTYPSKQHPVFALNGVSIAIEEGEILALLGVNGAGKTTLSSILATLHPPTSGDILFQGTSIYKNLGRYRKALGYCPQKPNLDPFLTVEENLIFTGRYFLMENHEIMQRAKDLMEELDLVKYSIFKVNELSGGYKQRVSIARALMPKPAIVIFDEPTVGLDPSIRRQLWDIIKRLKEEGVTVIITTHYLDEAEVLADRACIMNRGKIILIETVARLKAQYNGKSFEEIFLDITKHAEEANGEVVDAG